MIVSGSAIIKSDKPKEVIDTLRATTEKWIKINSEGSQWVIQFISNISREFSGIGFCQRWPRVMYLIGIFCKVFITLQEHSTQK